MNTLYTLKKEILFWLALCSGKLYYMVYSSILPFGFLKGLAKVGSQNQGISSMSFVPLGSLWPN